MSQMTKKQQAKRQRSLEWTVRYRWPFTALLTFNLIMGVAEIFEKHSQWSSWSTLLRNSFPPGIPVMHSVWANVFGVVVWSVALAQLWMRVHEYRREQLRAEQEKALASASVSQQGVWPPAPQHPPSLSDVVPKRQAGS